MDALKPADTILTKEANGRDVTALYQYSLVLTGLWRHSETKLGGNQKPSYFHTRQGHYIRQIKFSL
jgi:hypothetical protein